MRTLPLLEEHPRPLQFVLVVVVPALFGALTGYILGVSEPVYLVFSLIGIVGGIGAGYDHVGARAGALRGIVAGLVFGSSILIAHEIHGAVAKADLPEPEILLVVLTTCSAADSARSGLAAGAFAARRRALDPGSSSSRSTPAPAPSPAPAPEPPPAATAEPAPSAPAPAVEKAPRAPVTPVPAGTVVSLSTGSFDEYRGLGMSVTQAKRVLAYREQGDGFRSLDDLDQLPGFSKAFLAE